MLFAGLNVHEGDVAGWVTDSTRTENVIDFLADRDAQTPAGLQLHYFVGNLSAHFTPKVEAFLDDRPHIYNRRARPFRWTDEHLTRRSTLVATVALVAAASTRGFVGRAQPGQPSEGRVPPVIGGPRGPGLGRGNWGGRVATSS